MNRFPLASHTRLKPFRGGYESFAVISSQAGTNVHAAAVQAPGRQHRRATPARASAAACVTTPRQLFYLKRPEWPQNSGHGSFTDGWKRMRDRDLSSKGALGQAEKGPGGTTATEAQCLAPQSGKKDPTYTTRTAFPSPTIQPPLQPHGASQEKALAAPCRATQAMVGMESSMSNLGCSSHAWARGRAWARGHACPPHAATSALPGAPLPAEGSDRSERQTSMAPWRIKDEPKRNKGATNIISQVEQEPAQVCSCRTTHEHEMQQCRDLRHRAACK